MRTELPSEEFRVTRVSAEFLLVTWKGRPSIQVFYSDDVGMRNETILFAGFSDGGANVCIVADPYRGTRIFYVQASLESLSTEGGRRSKIMEVSRVSRL